MAGRRITGKFSEEEYALIKQIQEKEKINDNQLVRGGISFLVHFGLMKDFMNNSDFGKIIKPFVSDMEKYVNSPKVQGKIAKATSKINTKSIVEMEKEAKLIEKQSRVFTRKKKVGRPKIKKVPKKRGRTIGS